MQELKNLSAKIQRGWTKSNNEKKKTREKKLPREMSCYTTLEGRKFVSHDNARDTLKAPIKPVPHDILWKLTKRSEQSRVTRHLKRGNSCCMEIVAPPYQFYKYARICEAKGQFFFLRFNFRLLVVFLN